MQCGDVVGGRFELRRLAGSGGMGEVFQAWDLAAGVPTAVKILHTTAAADVARFEREARLLAQLSHPAIVRYVVHGVTPAGSPYLVMEWLSGEDLLSRLVRLWLTTGESITLAIRVAEALAAAHAMDIVHRDIKPSNLFLCGLLPSGVKLIDFGIARMAYSTLGATRTGTGIGTPGYMAPEQARDAREVDARADIFSLGCVLFECLTRRPAFAGEHAMSVLAKVLLEEPPRLRDLRPELPVALDDLLVRMLSKDPAGRPAAVNEVASALSALGPLDAEQDTIPIAAVEPVSRMVGEQRLVSVLLVRAKTPDANAERGEPPPRHHPNAQSDSSDTAGSVVVSTTMPEMDGGAEQALREAVTAHGGTLEWLADGTRVVLMTGAAAATDQAERAARCALSVRSALPGHVMALATGRSRVGGRWPVGEAIDAAAKLLWTQQQTTTQPSAADATDRRPLWVDLLTAGLLDTRFDVEHRSAGLWLRGERANLEGGRTLLGKQMPCVGRDRELRALLDLFDESASDGVARAVLVVAAAGVGKSRLRQEFVARLRETGQPVEIWVARGDAMLAGAPFGLLGQILRRTAKVQEGEPLDVRRQKLAARVGRCVDPANQERVAEFLGEMTGTPFPDQASTQLRAARQDARLMGDQMRRAWVDFVAAECSAQPVLLVLEDLHWGDPPTVEYIGAALRLLRNQPLMVLALARPDVRTAFPELWSERGVTEMPLPELSRRACERFPENARTMELAQAWLEPITQFPPECLSS